MGDFLARGASKDGIPAQPTITQTCCCIFFSLSSFILHFFYYDASSKVAANLLFTRCGFSHFNLSFQAFHALPPGRHFVIFQQVSRETEVRVFFLFGTAR